MRRHQIYCQVPQLTMTQRSTTSITTTSNGPSQTKYMSSVRINHHIILASLLPTTPTSLFSLSGEILQACIYSQCRNWLVHTQPLFHFIPKTLNLGNIQGSSHCRIVSVRDEMSFTRITLTSCSPSQLQFCSTSFLEGGDDGDKATCCTHLGSVAFTLGVKPEPLQESIATNSNVNCCLCISILCISILSG